MIMHTDGRSQIKSIPLSNDNVARRKHMKASDIGKTICDILKTKEFSFETNQ